MKRYVTALGIVLISVPAAAQWPGQSTSTTPEPLTINKVTYLIPRNYIYEIYNQYLATLKVTYPDFKPFTEQTQDCFKRELGAFKDGCRVIDFSIETGPYRAKKMFENFISNLPVTARAGPDGYRIYSIGPPGARTESYANADLGIYFNCVSSGHVLPDICTDRFSLADGNSAMFRFQPFDIGNVREIEDKIRKLIASFPVMAETK